MVSGYPSSTTCIHRSYSVHYQKSKASTKYLTQDAHQLPNGHKLSLSGVHHKTSEAEVGFQQGMGRSSPARKCSNVLKSCLVALRDRFLTNSECDSIRIELRAVLILRARDGLTLLATATTSAQRTGQRPSIKEAQIWLDSSSRPHFSRLVTCVVCPCRDRDRGYSLLSAVPFSRGQLLGCR